VSGPFFEKFDVEQELDLETQIGNCSMSFKMAHSVVVFSINFGP